MGEVNTMVRKQSADWIRVMPLRERGLRAQASEMSGRVRSERGASLVEFALSVSVMLTFIFGVMVMCTALYSYHFIADAAREGARYAMVRGSECTTYSGFTSNCPISTAGPIQTYVRGLALPGIDANNLNVTAAYSAYPSGTCTPSAACNNPGNQVQVTVSYQLPVKIPFVPAQALTMTSRSQMVIAD
jgi:Flp pilus assembly protein TadG